MDLISWLTDASNWSGQYAIGRQTFMHLTYSFIALFAALLVAWPLGIFIGHTGRGENFILGFANAMRALPTFGLLILLVLIMAPGLGNKMAFVIPTLVVLVLLAVPPILSGIVSGIKAIDPGVIDAAYGMGFSRWQVIFKVELPYSLGLTMSGVRGAMLQIVSTATVAAYVSLDGLGRFIIDGRASNDYAQMGGGAVLLVILALLLEIFFVLVTKVIVSPGLTRKTRG